MERSEDFNRAVFEFNDVIDSYLLKPIAIAYGWLLPEPVKQSVRNGVANLMSPVILANDLLQFEFRDAAITTSRLIANSTMGIGGLFDVSSGMGLPPHPSDFGQTLHSYGMDSGPYLVLPLLGPSTVRDGFGQGVDTFLHPFTYVLSTPVNHRRPRDCSPREPDRTVGQPAGIIIGLLRRPTQRLYPGPGRRIASRATGG